MSEDIHAAYKDFCAQFSSFIRKYPDLISLIMSNIFTIRLIGNKTHGDLAEIAITELINQYMSDFTAIHVGKDLYRAKSNEEDIKVTNINTKINFSVSLKTYGLGPLQLSTDKETLMFPMLEKIIGTNNLIDDLEKIKNIFGHQSFHNFSYINVLPFIYDEKKKICNILIFNYNKLKEKTTKIIKVLADDMDAQTRGNKRKHPIFKFVDANNSYICEVRYGGKDANALQRGLWTHTANASSYFDSLTNGWINYAHNHLLVKLIGHSLVSSVVGHEQALSKIIEDIKIQKEKYGITK